MKLKAGEEESEFGLGGDGLRFEHTVGFGAIVDHLFSEYYKAIVLLSLQPTLTRDFHKIGLINFSSWR